MGVRRWLLMLSVGVGVACSGSDTTAGPSTDALVRITPDEVALNAGETLELRALDELGRDVSRDVAWTSGDSRIAVVEAGGLLRTRAAGSVWIAAIRGAARDSVQAMVAVEDASDLPPDTGSGDPEGGEMLHALFGQALLDGREGVAGVDLVLTGSDGSWSTTSDGAGNFTFTAVRGGSYSLAFDVPPGYGLAEGQVSPMEAVVLPRDADSRILLKFSDAAGNGTLAVIAHAPEPDEPVNGVEVVVQPVEDDPHGNLLVTGDAGPGQALVKLQPAQYHVSIRVPTGYRLPEGAAADRLVQVRRGYTWFEVIDLARE